MKTKKEQTTILYSYSFKVNKNKLAKLKKILKNKNLDISKFLRNCIDEELNNYEKTNECHNINFYNEDLNCNDCRFKDDCEDNSEDFNSGKDDPLPF